MDIIQKARTYAVEQIEKYGTPPPEMFKVAEKKLLSMLPEYEVDRTVCLLGYYFMDIKLGEALHRNKISEHVQMSVEAAKEFLEESSLSEEQQSKIINCVAAHHRDVDFTCLEAEICANADCWRFIHPRGFLSFLITLMKERNQELQKSLLQTEEKMDEKFNKVLTMKECREELEPMYRMNKEMLRLAKQE